MGEVDRKGKVLGMRLGCLSGFKHVLCLPNLHWTCRPWLPCRSPERTAAPPDLLPVRTTPAASAPVGVVLPAIQAHNSQGQSARHRLGVRLAPRQRQHRAAVGRLPDRAGSKAAGRLQACKVFLRQAWPQLLG